MFVEISRKVIIPKCLTIGINGYNINDKRYRTKTKEERKMEYNKVWYYYLADEKSTMRSVIINNDEELFEYLNNDPYESGIEVFEIQSATEKEYSERYMNQGEQSLSKEE